VSGTIIPPGCEHVEGGLPVAPPVLGFPLFGQERFPAIHVSTAWVAFLPDFGVVGLCLARPDVTPAHYLGLTADQARAVAAWLLNAADDVDGGAAKQ